MSLAVEAFSKTFPVLARSMGEAHSAALLDVIEQRHFAAAEKLIQENQPSNTLYFLVDGRLGVSIDISGNTIFLGNIEEGGVVGEISMLDDAPATATVTAVSECNVLALSEEKFMELDKRNPAATTSLLRALSHTMSDRIRAATDLILPLLDAEDLPDDRKTLNAMLGNAYANLYGLGEKP